MTLEFYRPIANDELRNRRKKYRVPSSGWPIVMHVVSLKSSKKTMNDMQLNVLHLKKTKFNKVLSSRITLE